MLTKILIRRIMNTMNAKPGCRMEKAKNLFRKKIVSAYNTVNK